MDRVIASKWVREGAQNHRAWKFKQFDGAEVVLTGTATADPTAHGFGAVLVLNGLTLHQSEHDSMRSAMRALERAKDMAVQLRTLPGQCDDEDEDCCDD
jgi:hypothetical protein